MARIIDIVNAEKESPPNVVRLVRVQNGFVRAYNQSAWRFHTFINQYKLKRQYVKSINEETVSLGFKETNLHSVASGRQLITTEMGYDLLLHEDEQLSDPEAYLEWLSAIPMSNVSSADFDALPLLGADAEREVVRRLRLYPIERRSPIECQSFLASLRELLDP